MACPTGLWDTGAFRPGSAVLSSTTAVVELAWPACDASAELSPPDPLPVTPVGDAARAKPGTAPGSEGTMSLEDVDTASGFVRVLKLSPCS
ncbi:MAG: hypothetical protein ABJC87_00005 [Roseobacter sp.]